MLTLIFSCSNPDNGEVESLKKETAKLQRQVDSLKQVIISADSTKLNDSVENESKVQNPSPTSNNNADGKLTAGKHDFTLQWISWDDPGTVIIQPAEDGWFSIEGSQKNKKSADYISINGFIRQISATELEFKGEIRSVVETINGGKPCVRTGNKIFKTTKNRKYWRLQDMINCEGGMLTDYVDIYF